MRVTNTDELRLAIRAGNEQEIVLAPGLYLPVKLHGQTIRSEARWQAVFLSEPGAHNVYGDVGSKVIGIVSHASSIDGIKVEDGCEVRDCWVRHATRQGIASHSQGDDGDTIIEGNLIEFCGSHPQFDHGIYASGRNLTVARNILRHNAGRGLHLYPHLVDSLVHHNLVVKQACGKATSIHSRGRNLIAHNTLVDPVSALYVDGEATVANNLLIGPTELTLDANNWQGTIGDARFVHATREVYWLQRTSPCATGGVELDPIIEDFWGNEMPEEIYRGCFAYREAMTVESFRAPWEYGWPYQKTGGPIPDPMASERAGVIG